MQAHSAAAGARRTHRISISRIANRSVRSLGAQLGLEPLEQRLALTALPAGFTETLVTTASNLSNPTAMDFSPTGELWVLEQSGDVEFIRADGSKHTAIDLAVDSSGERGLLGLAFDPSYDGAGPNADYVYLYYTVGRAGPTDPANNQVVRFTVSGAGTDTPSLGSPQMIRELPPEDEDNNLTTNGDTNHNGGAIHFGPDGKLYVAIGDHNYDPPGSQQDTHVSQQLDTPFGKMLRLNPDGSNPTDNPFYTGSSSDWQGSIWAMGLRNPFTFAINPDDGRVFINDVGEGSWEEINAGEAAANFGWAGSNSPVWEGFENDGTPPPWANYHDPVMAYNHSNDEPTPAAVNITGGVFYPANSQFGAEFAGKYFFSDSGANFIRYFDPDNPGTLATPDTSSDFADQMSTFGPLDLKVDAEGNLYYLARGGEVYRISYTGDYGPTSVMGRHIFYNNSKFDGDDASISAADDAAIATDRDAYLPGTGIAQPESATSYSRGINGIMIDVAGNHGPLTLADFTFRVGSNNAPDTWSAAPAPSAFAVRAGEGDLGADRVVITWPDGAIVNTWLQVVVEGNDDAGGLNTNTGLATSDVFYFGNRIGETFLNPAPTVFVTSAADEVAARNNPGFGQPITNPYDFDRNGIVSAGDQIIVRVNGGFLPRIDIASGPPAAAIAAAQDGGLSAIATALSRPVSDFPAVDEGPATVVIDSSAGPSANPALPAPRSEAEIALDLALARFAEPNVDEISDDLIDSLLE